MFMKMKGNSILNNTKTNSSKSLNSPDTGRKKIMIRSSVDLKDIIDISCWFWPTQVPSERNLYPDQPKDAYLGSLSNRAINTCVR
jgi:hypothetical protein